MAFVFLETSLVSACVTNRKDVRSIYRRDLTLDWWRTQRRRHDLFVSPEVLRELDDPNYPLRDEAARMLAEIPVLLIDDEVRAFGNVLVRERVMPSPVSGDALHVAVSTVRGMQFILSWNVRHLANPNKRKHLQTICAREGYNAPEIVTPDLLWE